MKNLSSNYVEQQNEYKEVDANYLNNNMENHVLNSTNELNNDSSQFLTNKKDISNKIDKETLETRALKQNNNEYDSHNDTTNTLKTNNFFNNFSSFDKIKQTVSLKINVNANKTVDTILSIKDSDNTFSKKSNFIAAFCITISIFLFATISLIHKLLYMYTNDTDALIQVTEKYYVMGVISGTYLLFFNKKDLNPSFEFIIENKFNFFLRIFFGIVSGLLFVYSLKFITVIGLGISFIISPLSTSIGYTIMVERKKPKFGDLISFIISICCSLLITNPFSSVIDKTNKADSYNSNKGSIFSFLMVISFIFVNSIRNITQKLVAGVDINLFLMILGITGSFSMLILIFITGGKISVFLSHHLIILFIGVIDYVRMYFNTYALNNGEVSFIQQFIYLYLPFSSVLSITFTGEKLDWEQVVGMVLIFTLNITRSLKAYFKAND